VAGPARGECAHAECACEDATEMQIAGGDGAETIPLVTIAPSGNAESEAAMASMARAEDSAAAASESVAK
jgi:hypothetical protein